MGVRRGVLQGTGLQSSVDRSKRIPCLQWLWPPDNAYYYSRDCGYRCNSVACWPPILSYWHKAEEVSPRVHVGGRGERESLKLTIQ